MKLAIDASPRPNLIPFLSELSPNLAGVALLLRRKAASRGYTCNTSPRLVCGHLRSSCLPPAGRQVYISHTNVICRIDCAKNSISSRRPCELLSDISNGKRGHRMCVALSDERSGD